MLEIIRMIFSILAKATSAVMRLTLDPETGMTVGDLSLGAIFLILLFMVVVALGKRSSGNGGE